MQLLKYRRQAWDIMVYCSGTITPIALPDFTLRANLGGCSDNWANKSYKDGGLVQSMGLLYQCNAWLLSGNHVQPGYEPNGDMATPGA